MAAKKKTPSKTSASARKGDDAVENKKAKAASVKENTKNSKTDGKAVKAKSASSAKAKTSSAPKKADGKTAKTSAGTAKSKPAAKSKADSKSAAAKTKPAAKRDAASKSRPASKSKDAEKAKPAVKSKAAAKTKAAPKAKEAPKAKAAAKKAAVKTEATGAARKTAAAKAPGKAAPVRKSRPAKPVAVDAAVPTEEAAVPETRTKRKYTRRSKKAPVAVPKYQGKQGLLVKKKGESNAPVKPRTQKTYSDKDLDYFRVIIMQKIHDANEELMSIEERLNDSSSGEFSEDSTYSLHMADQGTDAMEREKAYLFAARERKFISHLTDALQRIKSGNYGICIVCSNLIEKGRLEAVPHARMCVNCKQETKAR